MKLSQTEKLIKYARKLSGEEDFDEDYGVDDDPFIIALNDAQLECQSIIVDEDASAFIEYAILDIVASQEAYDVPDDAFSDNLVYSVEYSCDGTDRQYYPLEDGSSRGPKDTGEPWEYVVESNKIYIYPVPNTARGTLRVKYEKALDALDKRRGKVASVTDGASFLFPETIVLEEGADDEALDDAEFICINSKTGTVKMRNIPVESYDSTTRTITIEDAFEAASTSSEIEAGDYVTVGENSTTHTKLKPICAPYLYNAAAYDAFRFKSSTDSEEQDSKLRRLKVAILAVYSRLPGGKTAIPETRRRY